MGDLERTYMTEWLELGEMWCRWDNAPKENKTKVFVFRMS